MKKTKCAICNTLDNSSIIYTENLPVEGISSVDYASRKKYSFAPQCVATLFSCTATTPSRLCGTTQVWGLGSVLASGRPTRKR